MGLTICFALVVDFELRFVSWIDALLAEMVVE